MKSNINKIRTYLSTLLHESFFIYGIGFSIHKILHYRELKRIRIFKNSRSGKRCFIIGTGPSLSIDDVNILSREECFGVNTLLNIYDKTDWRPDYYCIIDPNTYENIRILLKDKNVCKLFYPINRFKTETRDAIPFELECSSFYKVNCRENNEFTDFSANVDNCVFDGASVVYAALQIAVYMGFKDIYLLGVDCNYTLPKENLHGGDLSYSKDYNYNWTKQTGLTMIEGFKVAKKYADEHGINIYNATRGGMLEVFPRVKLEDVVGGGDE